MSTTLALATPPPESHPSSGLNFRDLLFIFYRHKIKIALFILFGAISAAGIFFFLPAPFESQSKLLVRYVVERSTVDTVVTEKGEQGPVQPVGAPSEAILNSEVEILTSSDLALQVAETVGPARLLNPGESPLQPLLAFFHVNTGKEKVKVTVEDAAIAIRKALEVKAVTGSNIISVTYTNKDPKLAVVVLDQIVQRYLEKHLEVHRSVGTFNYITKEAERLHEELTKTAAELKTLKEANGVTTILETVTLNTAELAKAKSDLDTAQSDLASQRVALEEVDKSYQGQNLQTSTPPDSKTVNHYQALIGRVEVMRKTQTDLLSKYSPESRMVKPNQVRLDALEKEKVELEKKYPLLVGTAVVSSTSGAVSPTIEISLERGRVAGLETRVAELTRRIGELQKREITLNEVAPRIAELERTRDVQETSYRYYQSSLEKARIDEGLNPSRMPNISVVQNPSPAIRATRDLKKVVIGLAGGSVVLGLALALFIELVLDRTIKRARELETRLRLPLMLTIPDFGGRLRLMDSSEGAETAVETSGEYLRPFCEAIRDRLGLFFELNNLAHKPKLVAVTGLSASAGVSTLAAGLADVLTEGGEGKVLLVDKPVNPKRFYSLMKEFKASDVDYIVFDMPSLGDTSATLPMAGFMDKVLLVVEAEKSGRDSVKRAYEQLSQKTDVSVIFNKSRIYGPKWLEGEL
jgi:polysaccharide biosynthesis transport protein